MIELFVLWVGVFMHSIIKNLIWLSALLFSSHSIVAMEQSAKKYPDNFYRMCDANLMTEADLTALVRSYLHKFEQAYKQYYFSFFDEAQFDSIFEPLVREMLQLNPRKDLYDLIPSIAKNAMNSFVEHCVLTEGGPYGKRLSGGYEEERYTFIYNNLVQKKCEQTRKRPDQLTEVEKKELAKSAASRNVCSCHVFIYWVEDLNSGRSKLQTLASRVADEFDALDGQCSYERVYKPAVVVSPETVVAPQSIKKASSPLKASASTFVPSQLKASASTFVPSQSMTNPPVAPFKPKIFTSSKKKQRSIAPGLTVTQLSTIAEASQSQELEEGVFAAAQVMQAASDENGFDLELSAIEEDVLAFKDLSLGEQKALNDLLEDC